MSDPAYVGSNPLAILSPHFNSITLATDGFPRVNADATFESGELGLRESSEFTTKSVSGKDATEREHLQSYEIDAKLPMMQTDLPTISNVYLWSAGLVQAFVALPNGKFLNFIKNAAGLPTPTGSSMFGMLPEITIDSKKILLNLMLSGHLYPEELDWLADNDSSAATGGSGGTTRGLVDAMGYDRSRRKRGNVTDTLIDGHGVGYIKDDFKFSLKAGGNKLNPNQTVAEWFDYSAEVMFRQVDKVQIKAMNWFANRDAVLLLKCAAGFQVKINAPGQLGEIHWDEKESGIKLKAGGRIYRNADEAAPNNLDIGVNDPAVLEILSPWS